MLTLTTTTMMMAMMMAMVVSVAGQDPWPKKPLKTAQEDRVNTMVDVVSRGRQNLFQEFFFVDPSLVPAGLYNQLFVTKEEAAAACKAMNASALAKSGRGGATAPHPRTCFAYLTCLGTLYNPTRKNTTYLFDVLVQKISPGTYYNPDTYLAETWAVDNNCVADPCKTGKPMVTGRSCSSYMTCETSDGKAVYKEQNCPSGNAFSAILSRCAPDANCTDRKIIKTENLRCYATGKPVGAPAIPGVPDEAYYNRTYRVVGTGKEVTVRVMCPASLVFDPNNTNSTKLCKCVKPHTVACPNTTLVEAGKGTNRSWRAAINSQSYTVAVDTTGRTKDWARFQRGQDFNYYDAQALAENELAGDWSLSFRFILDPQGGNPASFALAENTHDRVACPTPSLRVSVANSNTLRADVITKTSNGPITVQLDNFLTPSVSEEVEVVLERRAGSLKLKARKNNDAYRQNTANGLGAGPLLSNRCGLVFGKDFTGWIESVRLLKYGC